ncbi:MAG: hypothetical protein HQK54_02910 [Oligoflexales bacterium]|nr:hypothetical protein [Oligoflexales bacterium]
MSCDRQRIINALTMDLDYGESIELYESTLLRNAATRHKQWIKVVESLNIPRSTLDIKRKKYSLLIEDVQ